MHHIGAGSEEPAVALALPTPLHVLCLLQEAEKRGDFLENKLPAGVVEVFEFHARLRQVQPACLLRCAPKGVCSGDAPPFGSVLHMGLLTRCAALLCPSTGGHHAAAAQGAAARGGGRAEAAVPRAGAAQQGAALALPAGKGLENGGDWLDWPLAPPIELTVHACSVMPRQPGHWHWILTLPLNPPSMLLQNLLKGFESGIDAGGAGGGGAHDLELLRFCAAVAAELPYKKGDEPCSVVQQVGRGKCGRGMEVLVWLSVD